MHQKHRPQVRDPAGIAIGETARLVEEDSEKEGEAIHSPIGPEKVERVDERAMVEVKVVAQDKTYSMDREFRMPAWSRRHPYHRLQAWVVEAVLVPA